MISYTIHILKPTWCWAFNKFTFKYNKISYTNNLYEEFDTFINKNYGKLTNEFRADLYFTFITELPTNIVYNKQSLKLIEG